LRISWSQFIGNQNKNNQLSASSEAPDPAQRIKIEFFYVVFNGRVLNHLIMEKEFQYSIKSTSSHTPNPVIKCNSIDWSSSEELPHVIKSTNDQTYNNALNLGLASGETNPGYEYFDSSDTESVAEGMELNSDEVGMLCDFIDGTVESNNDTLPSETVNNVLEKVFKGGAALDNTEPRYKKDLKKRKENTARLDVNEKVTMAEIWELIRCQEGYREYSSQALNRGVNKVSDGQCGEIEFILEKEREAANQREMRKMKEQVEQLQKELNEIKLNHSPIGGNGSNQHVSINDDAQVLPAKKGILNTAIDFMFGEKNSDKADNCIIS